MDYLKKALGAIAQGLLFGLGFSIAAWLTFFATQNYGMDHAATGSRPYAAMSEGPATSPAPATAEPASAEPWLFSEVEEHSTADGRVFFTGKVTNKGRSRATGINIEVNLFQGAKFVDQYSSYLSGSIAVGESRYFKVSCGCKDAPPARHDSYKIQVLSGY